ncbi:hypothetical protein B0T14DRAFT_501340 [Immersiella caudata]|uniref:Uncharacterized protein n=1 Tax=Immersiella caudata TaxID=314043 RepID=A0AA39XC69_9PEZI|nr:hypothetical protein B0T14DRAFT_501340 [Immersiella caudata]
MVLPALLLQALCAPIPTSHAWRTAFESLPQSDTEQIVDAGLHVEKPGVPLPQIDDLVNLIKSPGLLRDIAEMIAKQPMVSEASEFLSSKLLELQSLAAVKVDRLQESGIANSMEGLAKTILKEIEKILQTAREEWAPALREAYDRAYTAAKGHFVELVKYVEEHPGEAALKILLTLLALGILAQLMPLSLDALGFRVLGPRAGSFAAWFQSTYGGHVTKGSVMAYLQSLGMTVGKTGVFLA